MFKNFILSVAMLGLASAATAGEGSLQLAGKIGNISIIEVSMWGHKAGNVEIAIVGGFTPPSGVICRDRYYLTTLASTDSAGWMLKYLNANRYDASIAAAITDDPQLQAFPGRCSIKSISW